MSWAYIHGHTANALLKATKIKQNKVATALAKLEKESRWPMIYSIPVETRMKSVCP
jgi:hypothetical protein